MTTRSDFESELVLQTERRGDVRIVKASGRVDFTTTPSFLETLIAEAKACERGGGLVIDVGGLDLITSSGLRALMQTKKLLSDVGAALVVVRVAGTVADVIRVARFDTLLTMKATVEDAILSLSPGAAGKG